MRPRPLLCVCLGALALAAPAQAAAPGAPPVAAAAEFFGFGTNFRLHGTNGYDVDFSAFTERQDGRGEIAVIVSRRRHGSASAVFYRAPAVVSEDFVKADLGPFGRVDVALHPSGRTRTIHIKCSKESYDFESGAFEGVVEFQGEQGYTAVSATRIPFQPLTSFCGARRGKGESWGGDEKGARLQGLSFAHGGRLTFQVNKNHLRRGRVPFSAELIERRADIQIHRFVGGVASGDSFQFDPDLRNASLTLPSPFSGSATLHRRSNAVTPRWIGDLSVDFPGHLNVRLAGPGVYVSLIHACFAYDGNRQTCN